MTPLIEQLKQRVESLIDAMMEDYQIGKSEKFFDEEKFASLWSRCLTGGIQEFCEEVGIGKSVEKFVFESSVPIILVSEDSRRTLVVENPPENDSEISIQISECDDRPNESF